MSIHDLDVARWMVGEVVEVYATGAALSDPRFAEVGDIDTALVTLRFASGALGVIDNSRVRRLRVRVLDRGRRHRRRPCGSRTGRRGTTAG